MCDLEVAISPSFHGYLAVSSKYDTSFSGMAMHIVCQLCRQVVVNLCGYIVGVFSVDDCLNHSSQNQDREELFGVHRLIYVTVQGRNHKLFSCLF